MVRRPRNSLLYWVKRMGWRLGFIAWREYTVSERIISKALDTPAGRAALAQAMVAPISAAFESAIASAKTEPPAEPAPEVESLLDRFLDD